MKNNRDGYILLETSVSLFIVIFIVVCLHQVIVLSCNMKSSIEDKVELYQQAEEINCELKEVLEQSFRIIDITTVDFNTIKDIKYDNLYNINSIKLDLQENRNVYNLRTKDKEINFKKDRKKIFINTLRSDNTRELGGYEIGDYVDSIHMRLENKQLITIILKLKKNKATLERENKIYMKNNQVTLNEEKKIDE